jgi:hypothetical protein
MCGNAELISTFVARAREANDDVNRRTPSMGTDSECGRKYPPGYWPGAKMTPRKIERAKALRAAGFSYREIAKQLGVTHACIGYLFTGKTFPGLNLGIEKEEPTAS